jgi:hypothetical protein
LTAGCAFGSIDGVGLLVGEVVIGLDVDVVAVGFTSTTLPPQAAVAMTVKVNAAAIKSRFMNM